MSKSGLFSQVSALSKDRRGNYAVILTISLTIPLGFGALALDGSFIRLTQNQAQDVADAASQTALFTLRRTADQVLAEETAKAVIARNRIGGQPGDMAGIDFGLWDFALRQFTPDSFNPNAVEVSVTRSGSNSVGLFLARTLGFDSFEVTRDSVSSTRDLQVILVMDITGSWKEGPFLDARAASLVFWDVLRGSYSDNDQIGMTIFTNRYSWAYTDMLFIRDVANTFDIDDDWSVLNIASKAGHDTNPNDGNQCSLNGGADQNNFASPPGGCYPEMPREYRDESGTDHTTGLNQAYNLFIANDNPGAYRAVVMLTDGEPNGLSSPLDPLSDGTCRGQRCDDGYEETRWPQYIGPSPRTADEIRSGTESVTQQMWDDLRVNTWIVSFKAQGAFMENSVHGDGYFVRTTNSSELADIFEDIANALPLAIVR